LLKTNVKPPFNRPVTDRSQPLFLAFSTGNPDLSESLSDQPQFTTQ